MRPPSPRDCLFLCRLLLLGGLWLSLVSFLWPRLMLKINTLETVASAPRLRKADAHDDVSDESNWGKWLQGQATRCLAEPSPAVPRHSALGLWKCLTSSSTLTHSGLRLSSTFTGQQGEARRDAVGEAWEMDSEDSKG